MRSHDTGFGRKGYFWILIFQFLAIPAFSQSNDSPVDTLSGNKYADGTQFESSFSTLKLGVAFMYEYAGFIQDEESKKQVSMENDFKVRDFRVVMSGQLKTKREIKWKAGIMYDGPSASWLLRETGVIFGLPEIKGQIMIGRTKEGYSMEKVMNGHSLWGIERAMAIDIIPILSDGIKYMGFLPKQRITWNMGVYSNALSKEQSFATYKWHVISRIAFLPFYTDRYKPVLHVGVNYRYGEVDHHELQVRSRPEANPAPYFIDTKKFHVSHSTSVGGEIYFRSGRLLAGTEVHAHIMDSPENDNPVFKGGEVFVNYIFTGEIRPYLSETGIFTFIKVKRPVFKGGPGAFEGTLKFSTYDLTDGKLTGGTFWRITPGVNWYLSDIFRLNFSYGYGELDNGITTGGTQFFQTRFFVNI